MKILNRLENLILPLTRKDLLQIKEDLDEIKCQLEDILKILERDK